LAAHLRRIAAQGTAGAEARSILSPRPILHRCLTAHGAPGHLLGRGSTLLYRVCSLLGRFERTYVALERTLRLENPPLIARGPNIPASAAICDGS